MCLQLERHHGGSGELHSSWYAEPHQPPQTLQVTHEPSPPSPSSSCVRSTCHLEAGWFRVVRDGLLKLLSSWTAGIVLATGK